jgi:DNA-nicking Smr family endonuclease
MNKSNSSRCEPLIFSLCFIAFFSLFAIPMGMINMLNTMMNTAFDLLLNTCFYLMAICVLAGALSALLTEFGVVGVVNRLLSPLLGPLYDLPGAASLGVVTTFLSDNPAILTLANDHAFRKYFKKYQLPALTNLGTAFGMGLIVCTYMISLQSMTGISHVKPVLVGFLGAAIGSIVSVRIMLTFTKKLYGTTEPAYKSILDDEILQAAAPEKKEKKTRQPAGPGNTSSGTRISVSARDVQTECDVRGCNLEEALLSVDMFLDGAILNKLRQVYIIHGKGTGILRSGIQQHLKRHPAVKEFRLGRYGEGEDGVTIVTLR